MSQSHGAGSGPGRPQHQQPSAVNIQLGNLQAAEPQAPISLPLAAQTRLEMRQRLDQASGQLNDSLRHLYASASSLAHELPPAYHNIPGIVPYYSGRHSGPPPSYDDVTDPHAGPPTYQSLFGQMRRARKRSRGLLDLARRLGIILLSTVGCTVLLGFMILIPFTMILVGAVYIDDCRIEHLPAYLLLGGLIWATKNIFHCYRQCRAVGDRDRDRAEPPPRPPTPTGAASALARPEVTEAPHGAVSKSFYCELVLNFSLLGWFVAGCVLVVRNSQPDFHDPSSARYCNKTVYMYTLWIVAMAMLLFCLLLGCFCCLLLSSALSGRTGPEAAGDSELGVPADRLQAAQ